MLHHQPRHHRHQIRNKNYLPVHDRLQFLETHSDTFTERSKAVLPAWCQRSSSWLARFIKSQSHCSSISGGVACATSSWVIAVPPLNMRIQLPDRLIPVPIPPHPGTQAAFRLMLAYPAGSRRNSPVPALAARTRHRHLFPPGNPAVPASQALTDR